MKLYYHPLSPNSWKVLLAAEFFAFPLNCEMIDLFKGEQRNPEYMALNLMAQVPLMITPQGPLSESDAIVWYIRLQSNRSLGDDETWTAVSLLRWMSWGSTQLAPALQPFQWERLFKPALTGTATDEDAIEAALPTWQRVIGYLDGRLATEQGFIAGPSPALADFHLAAIMLHADEAGTPLETQVNVRQWLTKIHSHPVWRSVQQRIETAA